MLSLAIRGLEMDHRCGKGEWQTFKNDPDPWVGFCRHGRRWDKDWMKIAEEIAAER